MGFDLSEPRPLDSSPTAPSTAPSPRPPGLPTWLWVSTTYFAEGLPYMVVRFLSGVYFTDIGMKESVIGYLNWLGIPWNFKFTWAPLVDRLSSKRRWMVGLELLIAAGCFVVALLTRFGPASETASASRPVVRRTFAELANTFDPQTGWSHQSVIIAILVVFVLMAFLSATHDVAIDAFYIEGVPDQAEQARYNWMRVNMYRLAVIFAKSALIGFSAWFYGFALAAAVMGALFVFHALAAPRPPTDGVHSGNASLMSHFGKAWASYLAQDRVAVILVFVLTYKLGDELLFSMNTPFLLRELGVTRLQLGWLSGWVGTFSSMLGAMIGSFYVYRVGFKKAIWPLTLAMNVNILAYVWLAANKPVPTTDAGFVLIALVHGYEELSRGLGNIVLTTFLLYTCKPSFKAAHYAIGTALMSVGGNVVGGFAGNLVERIGYTDLYWLAFFSGLPSLVIMAFLPPSLMAATPQARKTVG